jgi:hypothetical protein
MNFDDTSGFLQFNKHILCRVAGPVSIGVGISRLKAFRQGG